MNIQAVNDTISELILYNTNPMYQSHMAQPTYILMASSYNIHVLRVRHCIFLQISSQFVLEEKGPSILVPSYVTTAISYLFHDLASL